MWLAGLAEFGLMVMHLHRGAGCSNYLCGEVECYAMYIFYTSQRILQLILAQIKIGIALYLYGFHNHTCVYTAGWCVWFCLPWSQRDAYVVWLGHVRPWCIWVPRSHLLWLWQNYLEGMEVEIGVSFSKTCLSYTSGALKHSCPLAQWFYFWESIQRKYLEMCAERLCPGMLFRVTCSC